MKRIARLLDGPLAGREYEINGSVGELHFPAIEPFDWRQNPLSGPSLECPRPARHIYLRRMAGDTKVIDFKFHGTK